MEAFAKTLQFFYTQFLLRDFLAKIVPGAVIVVGIVWALTGTKGVRRLCRREHKVSVRRFLLLIGMAWILGFVGQEVGFLNHLSFTDNIRYGDGAETAEQRWQRRIGINDRETDEDRETVERLAVIKEATGNLAWALFLCFALAWLGEWRRRHWYRRNGASPETLARLKTESTQLLWVTVVVAPVGILLNLSHWHHARLQKSVEVEIWDRLKEKKNPSDSSDGSAGSPHGST